MKYFCSFFSVFHILYIRFLYSKFFASVRVKSLKLRGANMGKMFVSDLSLPLVDVKIQELLIICI